MTKQSFLRQPDVSQGTEYLVMGISICRDILIYKERPRNEGYGLICFRPDPEY